MNHDARLRPAQAARAAGVSRQLVNAWRRLGKIAPGDDGLYRLGDVLAVERQTRRDPRSSRHLRLERRAA